MKKFYFLLLIFPTLIFSQEKRNKLGFFGSVEANIGYDVAAMIKESQVTNEYERENLDPGKFNYGFSAQAGYQPLNWFALGTGLRYSFVNPNFHVIYWNIQSYFFVNNPEVEENRVYISANFGTQINKTASRNAKVIGLSVGGFGPVTKNLGNKFQVNLEVQDFDGNGTLFVGFTYGIAIFSNKNL